MSNQLFVLALGVGAGLLAVWIHARFPGLAPERMGKALLHACAAFLVLKLAIPHLGESTLSIFGGIFLLILPALVYALLCTIWMLKLAQTAMGLSR